MKKSFSIRDMIYVSLMAVVIALCSWLSVPSAVPFTMQTFAVFCALLLLGGRRGFLAVGLYILLGAFGLPVFSGFRGGIGVLLGPTGGYILGFLLTGLCDWLYERFGHERLPVQAACMVLGLVLCYAFGTAWFIRVYTGDITLARALSLCVWPFIIPDLIKLALALLVGRRVRRALRKE